MTGVSFTNIEVNNGRVCSTDCADNRADAFVVTETTTEHGELSKVRKKRKYQATRHRSAPQETLDFIEKARMKHGDRYDYSKVRYEASDRKVTIVCKEHGEFEQAPTSHLGGRGCKQCGVASIAFKKRRSRDDFTANARAIHGEKYDYSKLPLMMSKSKITIICKEHGEFEQAPTSHLGGRGCKKCGINLRSMKKTLSPDEFVAQAMSTHGDMYDYSKVQYKSPHINVTIICKEHGEFEQTPRTHLDGRGCSDCGFGSKLFMSQDDFITKASAKHGGVFDYSKVRYTGSENKVIIICNEHGEFEQTPHSHLGGNGCKKCGSVSRGLKRRLSQDEFLAKAHVKHGSAYDYSKVQYGTSGDIITIICKEHGEFKKGPAKHLMGDGCPKCGRMSGALKSKKQMSQDDFVTNAKAKHGERYDYAKVLYTNSQTHVTIICKEHGEFKKRPSRHLRGEGCQKCASIKGGLKTRMSQTDFITSAVSKYGERYDYSKVNYTKSATKVTIICKEHGEFKKTPAAHLGGKGCETCGRALGGMNKRLSQADFLTSATSKHGDRYDYSKVHYTKSDAPVTIICKEHGEFVKLPTVHLGGQGCDKCRRTLNGRKRTMSLEDFTSNARMKHGDRYDYSKVNYTKSNIKVTIICKEHGEFTQTPNAHLNGRGCEACGRKSSGLKQRCTNDEFVKKSKETHGDIYDYSKVNYTKSDVKVTIICKQHGEFEQTPESHLGGSGCEQCGIESSGLKKRGSNDEFIENARTKHGDRYDYSKVSYTKSNIKVTIICKKHGEFTQTPNKHLGGCGCKRCGNIGYSNVALEWLLFLQLSHPNLQTASSSNGEFCIPSTKYRADGYCPDTKTVFEFHGDFWHGNPKYYPRDAFNPITKSTFGELFDGTKRRKSTILALGYNFVEIWERDWRRVMKTVARAQVRWRSKSQSHSKS